MTTKLIEKREELRAKQAALAAIFEAAGPELDLSKVEQLKAQNGTTAKAAEVKRLNDELTALGQEVDGLVAVERAAADVKAAGERLTPAGGRDGPSAGRAAGAAQPEVDRRAVRGVDGLQGVQRAAEPGGAARRRRPQDADDAPRPAGRRCR